MFTGIIAAVGQLKSLESRGGDIRLHIDPAKLDLTDANSPAYRSSRQSRSMVCV